MSVSDGELVDIDDGFAAGPSPNSPADGDISPRGAAADIDDDSSSSSGLGSMFSLSLPPSVQYKKPSQCRIPDRQTDDRHTTVYIKNHIPDECTS